MATEMEDTLATSRTGGSGVYGVDTASVKGDKAFKSPVHDANEAILRLSIKGFDIGRGRSYFKGELILRVDQRKVALRLPLDRNKYHVLLIDLDRVVLVPCTYANNPTDFQCTLQEQENSNYMFNFETIQDLSAFQKVFTGFSVQIHIPDVAVCLQPKDGRNPGFYMLDVQLWRKVPNSFESLVHTHDGLRNPSQLPETGAKRDLLEHGKYPAQIHTTTASDKGLVSVNDSVMKRHASSLLVFGHVLKRMGAPLIRVPIDERISIAKLGPRGIKLVEDGAKTSHKSQSKPFASIAQRSSATTSSAAGLIALGLNATESNVQASRLSEIDSSIGLELGRVELIFEKTEDEIAFVAVFDAIKDPHELFDEAETHGSNRKSLRKQGLLTRNHKSAVFDADDVIPPAKQTSANPKLTPLHKAKAGQVNSSAPLSQPRRGLAGDSTNHPDGRADMIPLVAGSLDSKFRSRGGLAGNSTIHPDGSPGMMHFGAAINRKKKARSMIPLVTGSLDSKFGSRRGLAGNSTIHPDGRADIVPLVAGPLDSKFGSRGSLAGNPTNHPKKRARSMIPLVAGSLDSEFRSRRGLAGNPTNHPKKRASSMIPLVTGSLDSEFRSRRGLAGNPTNHPGGRADIVPLVAGLLGPSLEFHGRKRSSDVLDADPQRSTNSPITSDEVGEMRRLRRRRICQKVVVFMLWEGEQNDGVPNELFSSPASFDFINGLEISRFDKIKGIFEAYSGRDWDWWPFDPPAKPLESGKVRIRWRCTCGDQRWTDASRYLARRCQALANENTATGHERGNATSQLTGSNAGQSQLGSVVPGPLPSDTSQPAENTSNIRSTVQADHIQNTNRGSHAKDLYVLLCIYQGSQILHSQILASKCQNDEAFFKNLRQEYRRLRGFFRFWFSPLRFSHCDFVKFTRFYVNELAKVGHSLPIDLVYQYNPRPPGPHEDPPISPHEFRRRFYTHFANPCGRDEALERIPKRQKRFQINLHVDGREDMWGLHVELRPSFLVVLMWQIVITAGGWAFMGWWLSRHHGDLQNAAVPVTLIVTAVMALWAPIRKGMTEAL